MSNYHLFKFLFKKLLVIRMPVLPISPYLSLSHWITKQSPFCPLDGPNFVPSNSNVDSKDSWKSGVAVMPLHHSPT